MHYYLLKAAARLSFGILFTLICLVPAYAQSVKEEFILNGKISGVDSGKIFLSYYNIKDGTSIKDSTTINNGVFSFKGIVTEPTVAFISLVKNVAFDANATDIFLEPALMNVSLVLNKFNEVHLTGSNTQRDYDSIKTAKNALKEKYKVQWDQFYSNQFEGDKDSLEILLKPLFDSLKKIEYEYFTANPQSFLTAYLLQYHIRNLSLDSLTLFYNRLSTALQQHVVIRNIKDKISKAPVGLPGNIANNFIAKDVDGNLVVSRLYKGNYLLLDFWASWCVPCRKGNPKLLGLYNLYKEKGLRILGVADDDRDTSAWKKAIQTDGIGIWRHVLRGADKNARIKGLSSVTDISEKFDVGVLPTYILINPEGIIIGRYKEVEQLEEVFAVIFKHH